MERAYDLMGWDFIKAVMGRFGFAPKFIDLVMGCIRAFLLLFWLMVRQLAGFSRQWD